jgi:hypothetical protein
MARRSLLAFVGALLIAGTAAAQPAETARKDRKTDPANLGAQWWQMVSSLPAAVSPFFDDTKCGVGQSGPVWFLYSTAPFTETLGEPTEASCTIPTRQEIFLSLVGAFCIPYPGETLAEQTEICADGMDSPTLLRLEIDGRDRSRLIDRRVSNRPFTLSLAEPPNAYPGLPGGIYTAVHDGYFALLPPLKAGDHEVIYQAGITLASGQTVFFNTRQILHIVEPADVIVPIEQP